MGPPSELERIRNRDYMRALVAVIRVQEDDAIEVGLESGIVDASEASIEPAGGVP
jgi:hypothetical protein